MRLPYVKSRVMSGGAAGRRSVIPEKMIWIKMRSDNATEAGLPAPPPPPAPKPANPNNPGRGPPATPPGQVDNPGKGNKRPPPVAVASSSGLSSTEGGLGPVPTISASGTQMMMPPPPATGKPPPPSSGCPAPPTPPAGTKMTPPPPTGTNTPPPPPTGTPPPRPSGCPGPPDPPAPAPPSASSSSSTAISAVAATTPTSTPSINGNGAIDSNAAKGVAAQTSVDTSASKATIAVSVVIIIAGVVLLFTGAIFLIRRILRNRRLGLDKSTYPLQSSSPSSSPDTQLPLSIERSISTSQRVSGGTGGPMLAMPVYRPPGSEAKTDDEGVIEARDWDEKKQISQWHADERGEGLESPPYTPREEGRYYSREKGEVGEVGAEREHVPREF